MNKRLNPKTSQDNLLSCFVPFWENWEFQSFFEIYWPLAMYWSMKVIYDFMMSSSEENLQASHDYYFLFAKMQFFSLFMITAASLTFSDGSWWMTGGMKKDTASDLHSKPSTKTTFFDKVIKSWIHCQSLRIFEVE